MSTSMSPTRNRLLAALLGLLALPLAVAWAWAAAEPVTLTLSADEITGSLEADGVLEAVGNARINYQDGSIAADRIHLDQGQRVAAATGNVRVEREGQRLTGRELMYNLADGQGVIYDAEAEVHEPTRRGELVAFLMGKELSLGQNISYIIKGRFTTCDHKNPHYSISADQWRYVPGKRIVARGAQVQIYGLKLPKVRKLTYRLGKHEAASTGLTPRFGYSHVDGPYLGVETSLQPDGSPFEAGLEGRMSLMQGFRGTGYTGLDTDNWSLEAAYGINEDAYNDVRTGLLIDRLPEVAFRGRWPVGKGSATNFGVQAGWGRFRESPGRISADRRHVEGNLTHIGVLGPDAFFETSAGFRYSDYGTGEYYRVITGRFRLSGGLGHRFDGHLDYVQRFVTGSTPFEFDDVDITHEVATGFDWRLTKKWRVGTELRYDIDRGKVRRAGFELGRTFHCLEYNVHYDTVWRDLGFGISIPGL